MHRRYRLAITAAAFSASFSFGTSAIADAEVSYWYGRDLDKLCNAARGSGEYGICFSFVSAVLEIVTNNPIYGAKACIPALVTAGRAVEIIQKWLDKHPEHAMQPASLVVTSALADEFKCQQN